MWFLSGLACVNYALPRCFYLSKENLANFGRSLVHVAFLQLLVVESIPKFMVAQLNSIELCFQRAGVSLCFCSAWEKISFVGLFVGTLGVFLVVELF